MHFTYEPKCESKQERKRFLEASEYGIKQGLITQEFAVVNVTRMKSKAGNVIHLQQTSLTFGLAVTLDSYESRQKPFCAGCDNHSGKQIKQTVEVTSYLHTFSVQHSDNSDNRPLIEVEGHRQHFYFH